MNTNNMLPNSIIKNGRRFAKLFLTASFILMVTLSPVVSLTGLMKVKQVFADISEYSISVPATQTLNQNTQISIPGISISGGNTEDDLNFVLSISSGEIWLDDQTGVTVQTMGDGLLKISGKRDEINNVLPSLKYSAYNAGSFQLGARLTSDQGEVIGSNGHAYIFVGDSLSWENSRDAAAASTFQGVNGYLATITSEDENNIISTKLGSNGWVGISDDYQYINDALGSTVYADQSESEGKWFWVTGPESGTQVWEGTGSGSSIENRYNNWASSEPNNYEGGENCNEIYSSDGSWNDMPCGNGVGGYIVEYSGATFVSGPESSFTINVIGLEPESLSPENNATNVLVDSKLILDFGGTPENYPDGSFGIDSYDSDTAENLYLNIYDSNNNLFDSLNVSEDENAFAIDGNRVTITPHQNFSPNTTYYVQVDNNMFGFYQCDCSRFMWKGISDQVTWKFTTEAPVVVTTSSSSSAGQGAPWTPITTPTPVVSTEVPKSDACPADQLITQNLKAPSRNGVYNSYTKGIVKEVKILQAHLNRLGFNSGKVDGILGPISTGAIKRMQTFLGTKADGYVGPLTRALINNSCGEKGLQKS